MLPRVSNMIISRCLFQPPISKLNRLKAVRCIAAQATVKNVRKGPPRLITAAVTGAILGGGYYFYQSQGSAQKSGGTLQGYAFLENKPEVPIARQIKGNDKFDLQLILFQYPTCPFCCKVRAFLDYYGLPYDVVEVNPILRQQTAWTTYKKVPILLAKVDGGYQQLNDSSMIISALKTYLMDTNSDLKEIVNYYPMEDIGLGDGTYKTEILNKYSLMHKKEVSKELTEKIMEEKKWREWADNVLVHTLSPNVYRSRQEAMQAFTWFSEVGEWDRLFSSWERLIVVYVGAFAMWLISKRLKKRHNLKDDVRSSLYDECRKWMKLLNTKKTTFMGGNSPNLADLAVYGVLSSIEGCVAFQDLLRNTSIGKWYFPMKEAVANHKGIQDTKL